MHKQQKHRTQYARQLLFLKLNNRQHNITILGTGYATNYVNFMTQIISNILMCTVQGRVQAKVRGLGGEKKELEV